MVAKRASSNSEETHSFYSTCPGLHILWRPLWSPCPLLLPLPRLETQGETLVFVTHFFLTLDLRRITRTPYVKISPEPSYSQQTLKEKA